MEFKQFNRRGFCEAAEFICGEDILPRGSTISENDIALFDKAPFGALLGYTLRNPENHDDKWFVSKEYFDKNYQPTFVAEGTLSDEDVESIVKKWENGNAELICTPPKIPDVLLMSRENPDGMKLGDLLKKVAEEIELKSERIKDSDHVLRSKIINNNNLIISTLKAAAEYDQISNEELDKLAPNEGPLKPRL